MFLFSLFAMQNNTEREMQILQPLVHSPNSSHSQVKDRSFELHLGCPHERQRTQVSYYLVPPGNQRGARNRQDSILFTPTWGVGIPAVGYPVEKIIFIELAFFTSSSDAALYYHELSLVSWPAVKIFSFYLCVAFQIKILIT